MDCKFKIAKEQSSFFNNKVSDIIQQAFFHVNMHAAIFWI